VSTETTPLGGKEVTWEFTMKQDNRQLPVSHWEARKEHVLLTVKLGQFGEEKIGGGAGNNTDTLDYNEEEECCAQPTSYSGSFKAFASIFRL